MGDLLDHQPGRYSGGSQAAVYLGKIDADEPERTHLADEGPVERADLVALLVTRRQPVCGEPARRLLDGALLIGEGKLSSAHGNSPRPGQLPSGWLLLRQGSRTGAARPARTMPTVYRPFFKGKTVPHCRRGLFESALSLAGIHAAPPTKGGTLSAGRRD